MKPIWIISMAILLSWNIKAQDKKNEIYIGFNCGEHFDNSPYQLNRGGMGSNSFVPIFPTNISYTRNLKRNRGIMLDYNYSNYTYYQDRFNERLNYPGEVLGRLYHVFRASYIMDISQTKLAQLKFFFGPSLRVGEGDHVHSHYAYSDSGIPFEGHAFFKSLTGVGAGFGLRAKIKVYKNLSLALDTRYTRYISNRTRNEMINSLFFGYSFGNKLKE